MRSESIDPDVLRQFLARYRAAKGHTLMSLSAKAKASITNSNVTVSQLNIVLNEAVEGFSIKVLDKGHTDAPDPFAIGFCGNDDQHFA